jgi:hypothetical protein
MKKSLLSALGFAVALAFSMPVLGVSSAIAAATTAAMTTTATTAAPAKTNVKKIAAKKPAKKACKATATHKCPMKHKKHATKTAAPKKAY